MILVDPRVLVLASVRVVVFLAAATTIATVLTSAAGTRPSPISVLGLLDVALGLISGLAGSLGTTSTTTATAHTAASTASLVHVIVVDSLVFIVGGTLRTTISITVPATTTRGLRAIIVSTKVTIDGISATSASTAAPRLLSLLSGTCISSSCGCFSVTHCSSSSTILFSSFIIFDDYI